MKKENMIFRLKMEIGNLVNEMVAKLPDELFLSDSTTFLDPSMGGGQYVSAIENRLRTHGHIDENIKNRVFGVEKSLLRVNYAIKKNKLVGTYSIDKSDVPSILIGNMKFDCIVGNPPYQKAVGERKTEPLWHIFVENSIKSLNPGGCLCFVHPPGWRDVEGKFKEVGNLMVSKDVQYLEMHSKADGNKTFNASIPYDWYVMQNVANKGKTTVKFQDGDVKVLDLLKTEFLPNGAFDSVTSLFAKNGEEKVQILWNCDYHTQRLEFMSDEKSAKFKYPIVYTVKQGDKVNLWYSSEKKGHFGIPKIIWSNGGITMGMVVDETGKYGLTQFAYAVVDTPNNLPKIKQALTSDKFKKLVLDSTNDGSINRKVLALFRKDFYKEFL